MFLPFPYIYFNIIVYLGSVQAGLLKNRKTGCLFCVYSKEHKIKSHRFNTSGED